MKRLNILILESHDGTGDVSDMSRAWKSDVIQPLMEADLAVRIEKDGRTEVVKNRFSLDVSSLIEEISSAYAEGKL